ncbi:KH domain-containing protein [Ditylenchus destructor]|nr:KH domain-containing protein [Ditylenchus destructor]
MEIEVGQSSGVYVKAFVEQVAQNSVLVSYENNSKLAELCPFDRCRCVLTEGNPNAPYVFKTGDIVDAFMQQADGDQQSIVCAWQKAKVKDIKEDLAVVESVEGPQNIDTVNMSSRCRPVNSASPITYESFQHHLIDIPGDLKKYFSNLQSYKDLTDLVKDIHVEYLKETGQIKVVSLSSQSINKVKMLSGVFITSARKKNKLVQKRKKTENKARETLTVTERNVSSKCASSSHVSLNCVLEFMVAAELMGLAIGTDGTNIKDVSLSYQSIKKIEMLSGVLLTDVKEMNKVAQKRERTEKKTRQMSTLNDVSSNYVVEFTVATELMGLAIGSRGINIANARKIEGVEKVTFDEGQKENGVCTFKVLAKTQDAAEQARSLLEYVMDAVPVPSTMIGQVIGKSFKTIQDIVDRSGVVRYKIDNDPKSDGQPMNETVDITFTERQKRSFHKDPRSNDSGQSTPAADPVSSNCADNFDVSSNCVVEFTVVSDLMGLAIGAHGTNIANARKIEGVEKVTVDESQKENGVCTFKVLAKTQDAAEQAKSMLEFIMNPVPVPRTLIGQVIGKSYKTIQDIVERSGVVRYKIGNDPKFDGQPMNEMVDITFIGTREAITNAEILTNYHLKHLKDLEKMRESGDDLLRKMHPQSSSLNYNSRHQQHSNGPAQSRHSGNGFGDGVGRFQQSTSATNGIPTQRVDDGTYESFQITVENTDGTTYSLSVHSKMTVFELKKIIRNRTKGLVKNQKLFFDGNDMSHHDWTLFLYGITNASGITHKIHLKVFHDELIQTLPLKHIHAAIGEKYLSPKWHVDLRNITDNGKTRLRGGRAYNQPLGCMRFGIRVLDKHENNKWLGLKGVERVRTNTHGEWPVAYHGTTEQSVLSILEEGFRLDKGKRICGEELQLIIQCRVDPSKMRIVAQPSQTGHGEYWTVPSGEDIRPYAVCAYEKKPNPSQHLPSSQYNTYQKNNSTRGNGTSYQSSSSTSRIYPGAARSHNNGNHNTNSNAFTHSTATRVPPRATSSQNTSNRPSSNSNNSSPPCTIL